MSRPEPCALVIFGATGDLTTRKLMPSLFALYRSGALPEEFSVIGVGRREKPVEEFRAAMRDAVEGAGDEWDAFATRLTYVVGGAGDPEPLRRALAEAPEGGANRLLYLATPPSAYEDLVGWLGENEFASQRDGWARVVVEKPFGRDLESASALNDALHRWFDESQVFRIDHYLGKETVQNLFVFRFANGIFEPVWNRRYVDHVQITVAESIGVGSRGSYFEEAGAVRDIVQNHLLQLLALTAMEPPVEFSADAIRDEKVKVLHALQHGGIDEAVRGQYTQGVVDGSEAAGYTDEENVDPKSRVETYMALEVSIDNWRWAGVPWFLRTGKRMPKRVTEVAVHFKAAPFLPFASTAVSALEPNVVALRIQPNEGISLRFGAKAPGDMEVRNVTMDFDYDETFGADPPEAYERLLVDAMLGDATLFTRADEVAMQWQFVEPMLDAKGEPLDYPAGSWGPPEAATLIAPRRWRRL